MGGNCAHRTDLICCEDVRARVQPINQKFQQTQSGVKGLGLTGDVSVQSFVHSEKRQFSCSTETAIPAH